MRLIKTLALLLVLGLLAAPANAVQEASIPSGSYLDKSLYCSGDILLNYAPFIKVEMDDTQGIFLLEQIGVFCKRLNKEELWYVDDLALRVTQGSWSWRIIFHKFRDDNKTSWYRWEYKE